MEFLITMENETRDVDTCQMVSISKEQILRIKGGNSCSNSHGGNDGPDNVTVGEDEEG
jgi:hypothetical protein